MGEGIILFIRLSVQTEPHMAAIDQTLNTPNATAQASENNAPFHFNERRRKYFSEYIEPASPLIAGNTNPHAMKPAMLGMLWRLREFTIAYAPNIAIRTRPLRVFRPDSVRQSSSDSATGNPHSGQFDVGSVALRS